MKVTFFYEGGVWTVTWTGPPVREKPNNATTASIDFPVRIMSPDTTPRISLSGIGPIGFASRERTNVVIEGVGDQATIDIEHRRLGRGTDRRVV